MEGAGEPLEWVSESRRLLLGLHVQPPLTAPVSRHHLRTNLCLGTAIAVFMVFGVGALFCCCYQWEWRLRMQSRTGAPQSEGGAGAAQAAPSDDQQGGQGQDTKPASTKISGQESSLSVLMPGDDMPRFIAWASPHRSPAIADSIQPPPASHLPVKSENQTLATS